MGGAGGEEGNRDCYAKKKEKRKKIRGRNWKGKPRQSSALVQFCGCWTPNHRPFLFLLS